MKLSASTERIFEAMPWSLTDRALWAAAASESASAALSSAAAQPGRLYLPASSYKPAAVHSSRVLALAKPALDLDSDAMMPVRQRTRTGVAVLARDSQVRRTWSHRAQRRPGPSRFRLRTARRRRSTPGRGVFRRAIEPRPTGNRNPERKTPFFSSIHLIAVGWQRRQRRRQRRQDRKAVAGRRSRRSRTDRR